MNVTGTGTGTVKKNWKQFCEVGPKAEFSRLKQALAMLVPVPNLILVCSFEISCPRDRQLIGRRELTSKKSGEINPSTSQQPGMATDSTF